MTRANTIARCIAALPDGSSLTYEDWDDAHIRQHRFAEMMARGTVYFTAVTTDGGSFGVDLIDGTLNADGEIFETQPQPTPLRLIYYKRMVFTTGDDAPQCQFFAVGWQTTTADGRNLRIGIKVFPAEHRWEITEDI